MTIEDKNYVTITLPCPKSIHKQLKIIASAKGKTIRNLLLELCVNDLFGRPENKELLAGLK
jgi:hypothetical protein